MQPPRQIHALDALTCGGFIPYRDALDRPRLFDAAPIASKRSGKTSRKLQRLALAALSEALTLDCEASWRAWMAGPMESYWGAVEAAKLGLEERRDWHDIGDAMIDAVHVEGWKLPSQLFEVGARVRTTMSQRLGVVLASGSEVTRVHFEPCECRWCAVGKPCITSRTPIDDVSTCMLELAP